MTNQEAIDEIGQALDMAIEALEKQIPIKPTRIKVENELGVLVGSARFMKGTIVYKCQCGCFISKLYKFCYEYGQAINWENE